MSDFRICHKPACIEATLADRIQKISEIERSIDDFRLLHDKETKRKIEEIEALKAEGARSAIVTQYEQFLAQWKECGRSQGVISRYNHMIWLQAEVEEIARLLNRPTFDEEYRRWIWERDNKTCYLCHRAIQDWTSEHMHIDHVYPRAKGGSDREHNLRAAHPQCNLKKSDNELGSRKMRATIKQLQDCQEDNSKGMLF